MMKTNYILYSVLLLFTLVACNPGGIDNNEDGVSDLAPKGIKGKALVLYNSKMQKTLQASGFTSTNTCTVQMIVDLYTLTATPTYTYTKGTANNANLEVIYFTKLKIGSDISYLDETYTAALTFTSASGGTYTGNSIGVTKNKNYVVTNNYSRSISGTFTLN